jgi:hypothetical protein
MADLLAQQEINQLGACLREINPKILHGDREGSVRIWYQGNEPYFDLFIEVNYGAIEWFQMTLRGQSLSWDRHQTPAWQTGLTNEFRTDDTNFYSASKTIESDDQLNEGFIELVEAICRTRAGEKLFDNLLDIFEKR